MRLNRAAWKGAAAAWGAPLRGALWAAALGLLAAALVFQAWKAYGEVRGLDRRRADLDRRVDRLRAGNRSLREELHALKTDPVYVESVLRDRRMAGPRERVVK